MAAWSSRTAYPVAPAGSPATATPVPTITDTALSGRVRNRAPATQSCNDGRVGEKVSAGGSHRAPESIRAGRQNVSMLTR
ncbi:hypothetical protein GCM10027413_05720 [Conyzicola nivalis]|uniref:Uncharacterized protein n=1 Tax=Conyzicola nivalis TaxID=1477021 RepID=A0A916WK95_9MICO|nr:hypothetical protein GCM10010979_20910 [Conyzicola nivalis]